MLFSACFEEFIYIEPLLFFFEKYINSLKYKLFIDPNGLSVKFNYLQFYYIFFL